MDPEVIAAIARWPNVPAVFGWLSLTARGQWLLRGEGIGNDALREFIGRNYAGDARGRWYFQNGPQRVYVALAVTPWVYRVGPLGTVTTHTGRDAVTCSGAGLLDDGHVLLVTDLGPGVVDDRDTATLLRAVTDPTGLVLNEQGLERWMDGKDEVFVNPALLHLAGRLTRIAPMRLSDLPQRFGFIREPQADQADQN